MLMFKYVTDWSGADVIRADPLQANLNYFE